MLKIEKQTSSKGATMQIYLDGIGLIKDSTVKLDGLTVITGENNSGKSTVGKALYAIIDGMIDIDLKQERDEIEYVRVHLLNELKKTISDLSRFTKSINLDSLDVFYELDSDFKEENIFSHTNLTAMQQLFMQNSRHKFRSKKSLYNFIEKIYQEITEIKLEDKFQDKKNNVLIHCTKILNLLQKGSDRNKFRNMFINHMLASEFKEQVQPIKKQGISSKIIFEDSLGVLFEAIIEDDTVVSKDFNATQNIFSKSYFIDNAFILDEVPYLERYHTSTFYIYGDFATNSINIATHKEKLLKYLSKPYQINVTNELEQNKFYDKVQKHINDIIPGDLRINKNVLEYVENGIPLKASNLATGSKMFGIIKMILDKYGLDDSTMLILDEPEAHLHPKWQNAFAEVIVILVKELNVNVLLTSHSPTFVLAIEAFMRKYEIIEKTNFYHTELQEDGFVKYKCVNDDLSVIYEDFAAYYGVVKYIREKYYGEFDPDEREDT